jgi:hypothetical protein
MKIIFKSLFLTSCLVLSSVVSLVGARPARAVPSLGLLTNIVSETAKPGSFPLARDAHAAPISYDRADYPGVARVCGDLQADIERVTSIKPALSGAPITGAKSVIIVGTLGKNAIIDSLVKSGKIKVGAISGKWESFLITTVNKPAPGIDNALVIAGSDKRGTIYGVYEISEQIGVSPWYWWADVPSQHHHTLYIKSGSYIQGAPAVKYRGIFINDEEPELGGWSREKFGGINSKMYAHMFELILRLRGNYLWPAMWGKAFNEDDPDNPRVADEYGVVMGTSHHEPMLRAQSEWGHHRTQYGNGEWNYMTNHEGLKKFWIDGIERNKNYESIITMGIRGDGDVAMPDAGGTQANIKLLEKIMADQQQIIAEHLNPDQTKVPQLWALFTEVQGYYDAGLKVPDNITLLFTDDNVGDLRRVPTPEERKRSGGAGVYYHMDMNGGPFSYKWVNSNPLPKIWEQMNLAHQYGANQIWIANVGSLKNHEVPLEFFLRMGWNPDAVSKDKIAQYQLLWAEREFGKEHAVEIADLAAKFAKYNGWRKPEQIRNNTFSLTNYREAERVSQQWNEVASRAEKLYDILPQEQRAAFYQLVLHPAKASANLVDLYIAAGRNQLYAKQGRASANAEASLVRDLFKKDQQMTDYFNKTLVGGKWDHMMDMVHIGYTIWSTPDNNIIPRVTELPLQDVADFGVAVEGSTESWPGSVSDAVLPAFDSLNRHASYIDVFAKGTKPLVFKYASEQPWIVLKEDTAPGVAGDKRIWVDVDWTKLPAGQSHGNVVISGSSAPVTVKLTAIKASDAVAKEAQGCFGSLAGSIAFLAQDAVKNIPAGDVRWEKVPDFGRVPAGMEIFPVTAASSANLRTAPRLEYPVYFARSGRCEVDLITGLTLDIIPGRQLGIAVGVDNQEPQVVNVFTPENAQFETFNGRNYYGNAANNDRVMKFNVNVDKPGKHVLKLIMVDPTVIVQKAILHDSPLPTSYFGPPSNSIIVNGSSKPVSEIE